MRVPFFVTSVGSICCLLAVSGCQQDESQHEPVVQPAASVSTQPPDDAPGMKTIALTGETSLQPSRVARSAPRTPATGDYGVSQSAITTGEVTADFHGGENMGESASGVIRGSDGTMQTMVTANNMNGGENQNWNYGCFNGSNFICELFFDTSWASGSDPSITAGNDGFMYMERLRSTPAGGGALYARSSNPCPSNCSGVSWSSCVAGISIDWSQVFFADSTSHVWTTYNDFNADLFDNISLSKLTWCSSISTFSKAVACGTKGQSKTKRNPHAVMGGNGLIHVVWANLSDSTVEYTTFNSTTNTWNCQIQTIGSLNTPLGTCPSGGPVMPNLGNHNLEFDYAPRIARDPVSGVLVITFDSFDSSAGKVRSRALRSTNGGLPGSWVQTLLVSDETAKSTVAAGAASTFEIGHTYKDFLTPSNKGAQVRWLSTDGGATWGGLVISSFRTLGPVSPISRQCFWGDYDSVSWHSGNNAFLHTWSDINQGANSVIRGRFFEN